MMSPSRLSAKLSVCAGSVPMKSKPSGRKTMVAPQPAASRTSAAQPAKFRSLSGVDVTCATATSARGGRAMGLGGLWGEGMLGTAVTT